MPKQRWDAECLNSVLSDLSRDLTRSGGGFAENGKSDKVSAGVLAIRLGFAKKKE